MKRIFCLIITLIMILGILPVYIIAADALENPVYFTWAWDKERIDADNEVKVVSWSGGDYSSYRSSFIVYDLPENFTYESVKSEVIISFAINKATLNNGEGQAPTAAIVLVNGDMVKDAYNLKSGSAASKLLNDAKDNGVYFGKYKIGKYPRTSRIKNKEINEYFEKKPNVKSIGFYVTNIPSDGYSDMVGGIASAMSDFEVNFNASNNFANAFVKMVDPDGNLLGDKSVRGAIGSSIDVPVTIEKDDIIWVRDSNESVIISESVSEIVVNYHSDEGNRRECVTAIESMVDVLVEKSVVEKLDLPTDYVCDDGFVAKINWYSSNEDIVDTSGNIYPGEEELSVQLYADVWIGEYTVVQTKRFNVTVGSVNMSEIEESLIIKNNFDDYPEYRGSFDASGMQFDNTVENGEFTIAAFIRCDDAEYGGNVFECGSFTLPISSLEITEGEWTHVAVNNTGIYINGEKIAEGTYNLSENSGYIGKFKGKTDNFRLYGKSLSQSLIKTLCEEEYDSPKIEIISTSVVEGLDSVIVKIGAKDYSGDAFVAAYADKNGVRNSGYSSKEINEGINVFSVAVPRMGGGMKLGDVKILLWQGIDTLIPLNDKKSGDRVYSFGFNYENPDNHMLHNKFTLKNTDTTKYLSINNSRILTAAYENDEGYYSLKSESGAYINGCWSFIRCGESNNTYQIKNRETGGYLAMTGSSVHEKTVADRSCIWELDITEFDDVSRAFISEGFFLLSENERERLYEGSGQAIYNSRSRREKLEAILSEGYFELDSETQAEKLREVFSYAPSYQMQRPVNSETTGCETSYVLSVITSAQYKDMEDVDKTGYTATAVYRYDEGEKTVKIYARSHNVIKNIAKGLSYMPYQFAAPLETVIDYNSNKNQFKAEKGVMYILTNYEVSVENFAITGAHELGHLVDFAGFWISVGEEYTKALKEDCYVLSGYADTARSEDFAEFCQFVISCMGDKEQLRQLSRMFPGRYSALCKGMCEMYGECILK